MAELTTSEYIDLIYRLTRVFNTTLDLQEVLNRVIDEVIGHMQAERGFVMLRGEGGELRFASARAIERGTIESPSFQISRTIVNQVADTGVAQVTTDAMSDASMMQYESVVMQGLRSILCVPLKTSAGVIGVIYVDNRWRTGVFTRHELRTLEIIADYAAVAIENARLHEIQLAQAQLERELQLAHELQQSLMPRQTPQIPGWRFASWWRPARDVSGDFFDFIALDERHLGVVVADVSDKGMAAALFMVLGRSAVRGSVARDRHPAESITQVNRLLHADSERSMFITMVYAQIDTATGQVIWVNAGHNPPFKFAATGGDLTPLMPTGVLLGIQPDGHWAEDTTRLAPGDTLVLYTDGITEAFSPTGEMFGDERLMAVLSAHRNQPAEQIVDAIKQALASFMSSNLATDDITVVVIQREAQ